MVNYEFVCKWFGEDMFYYVGIVEFVNKLEVYLNLFML